ncbi:unnamed protein product [Clonostachys rosea f. rosea IK726]|uniref:Uncharacterized protein n=1 Tax=Clonostachys rosea f. rosea IK726 TaxID=1349383 RepID=A0ACA9UTS1_BIOOC|nr:unnamed protein product [Clonostachys rosea f. rosea IK726]
MTLLWKTLLVASFELGVRADDQQSNLGQLIQIAAARLIGGSSLSFPVSENQTAVGDVLPLVREIRLEDLIPTLDSTGNSRCCPPGTINDGTACVFPESSVCPQGSRLEGNMCVSTPLCPDGLVFDGVYCSDPWGPHCPKDTKPDGNLCVSESKPKCAYSAFDYKYGKCVAKHEPSCPAKFDFQDGWCWSRVPPKCVGKGQVLERGVCIDPAGPSCPEHSSPTRDGRCVGDREPDCEEGYKHVEGLCRHKGNMYCEGDAVLNGDNCETKEIPSCEDGTPKGETCIKDAMCDSGYSFVDGMCSKTSPAACTEADRELSKDSDSGRYMCCPKGTSYNGVGCRSPKGGNDKCPPGSEEDGAWCQYKPRPVKCPPLMELRGDKCEARAHPDCPEGDYHDGKCILKQTPTCPRNFHLVEDECVKTTKPKCPGDSKLFNGKCLGGEPSCPPRFRLEKNECIADEDPTCKDGYFYSDGLCRHPSEPVCERPTYLHKGKCIWPDNPDTGECVSKDPPRCDGNGKFRLVDGKCVRTDGGPECVAPLQRVGDKCVIIGGAKCPDGHKRVGNDCISDKDPRCEGALTFDQATGKCVSRDGPKCPDGTKIADGRCESEETPKCPTDHAMDNDGKCVASAEPHLKGGQCILDSGPDCPEGTEPVGNLCIAKNGPKCTPPLVPSGTACISTDIPQCGQNMAFDRATSKCIVATKRECFTMEVCPAVGAPSLPVA